MASAQGPDSRSGGSHEFVDHTSEVTIRLHAPSFAALLVEATRAFAELVPVTLRGGPLAEWREFDVRGSDRAASLVEWLNELIYLGEADQRLVVDAEVEVGPRGGAHIRARGRALRAPFVLVKAATLHRASVRDVDGGLEAEVTLDV